MASTLEILKAGARRLRAGLRRWPSLYEWTLTAGIAAGFFATASAIGFGSGLFRLAPGFDPDLLRIALIAILLPAIGEELVFRGAMVAENSGWGRCAVALLAFVAWHPLNARLFFPEAVTLFDDGRFLLIVGLLGASCIWLWQRTRSLWPPILLHWLTVVLWKAFLEGPRLF